MEAFKFWENGSSLAPKAELPMQLASVAAGTDHGVYSYTPRGVANNYPRAYNWSHTLYALRVLHSMLFIAKACILHSLRAYF